MKGLNKITSWAKGNSNHICTYLGAITLVGAVVESWFISKRVNKKIEAKKKELNVDKLELKETLKLTWKEIGVVSLQTATGVGLIIAGDRLSAGKAAAFASAASISQTALIDYKNAVREVIKPEDIQKINDSVAKQQEEKNYTPASENKVVYISGNEDYIIKETLSQRELISNWNRVQQAYYDIMKSTLGEAEPVITLNDWLYALGFSEGVTHGDSIGWNLNDRLSGKFEIEKGSSLTTDGKPCLSIIYYNEPQALK